MTLSKSIRTGAGLIGLWTAVAAMLIFYFGINFYSETFNGNIVLGIPFIFAKPIVVSGFILLAIGTERWLRVLSIVIAVIESVSFIYWCTIAGKENCILNSLLIGCILSVISGPLILILLMQIAKTTTCSVIWRGLAISAIITAVLAELIGAYALINILKLPDEVYVVFLLVLGLSYVLLGIICGGAAFGKIKSNTDY